MKQLLIILFVLCFCVSTFGQFIPIKMFGQQLSGPFADGLVFWFRGIESGNAPDESPYGNHGTITGATWVGDGLLFDGDNDEVAIGDIGLHTQLSVIMKVMPLENADGGYFAIGSNNQALDTILGIRFDTTNRLRVTWGDGTTDNWGYQTTTTNSLIQNEWAYITAIWDNNNTYPLVYINGILDVSGAQARTGTPIVSNGVSYLGAGVKGWANCGIADVKIYNRALSQTEILALYINPDLPMQQDPIWLLFSPAAPSGIVPIIQAHTRRRRAG